MAARQPWTWDRFLEEARRLHGDAYEYAEVEPIKSATRVTCTCLKHNRVFTPTVQDHIGKRSGCPDCGRERTLRSKVDSGPCKDLPTFLAKAAEVHGDKYDYSKVVLGTVGDPVEVVCHALTNGEEHGSFWPTVSNHLNNGTGCPKCGMESRAAKRRKEPATEPLRASPVPRRKWDNDRLLEEARRVHGDQFSYRNLDVKSADSVLEITCLRHNVDFSATVDSHIYSGTKCPSCKKQAVSEALRSKGSFASAQSFLEKARSVHGDKYTYPGPFPTSGSDKVAIVCPAEGHGQFYARASNHLFNATGCPKCKLDAIASKRKHSRDRFVKDCVGIHGDTYDYSCTEYISAQDEVEVGCRKHGTFRQLAYSHKAGHGCRRCMRGVSRAQTELYELLLSKGVRAVYDYKLPSGQEIDVYCPDHKVGFEYNGLYWHGDVSPSYQDPVNRHLRKTIEAQEQGIKLVHIFEDEWLNNRELCQSWVLSKVGVYSVRYFARKCVVKRVPWKESASFLDKNHMQGRGAPYWLSLGLFCKETDDLVGVMTFSSRSKTKKGNSGTYEVELSRFCTKGQVVGGFSKLLKHFISNYSDNVGRVVSFSDRRWSLGDVYLSNGFTLDGYTSPDYYWCKGPVRLHKRGFQHKYLASKLKVYDPNLTEVENCRANGYWRVYDCGKARWVLDLG